MDTTYNTIHEWGMEKNKIHYRIERVKKTSYYVTTARTFYAFCGDIDVIIKTKSWHIVKD